MLTTINLIIILIIVAYMFYDAEQKKGVQAHLNNTIERFNLEIHKLHNRIKKLEDYINSKGD